MKSSLLSLAVVTMLPCSTVDAADGLLDPAFGNSGMRTMDLGQGRDRAVALAKDGSIRLVSRTQSAGLNISHFDADGKQGTAVYSEGPIAFGADAVIHDAHVQSDGKLVVLASQNDSEPFRTLLCRFDTANAVDASFGNAETPGCQTTDAFSLSLSSDSKRLAAQSDGKFVIAGSRIVDNVIHPVLWQLTTSGLPDDGFGSDGNGTVILDTLQDSPTTLALDVSIDGKLLLAGAIGDSNVDFFVARVNADGTLDETFNGNDTPGIKRIAFDLEAGNTGFDAATSVRALHDGSILVAGVAEVTILGDKTSLMSIAKLQPDGELDTSFNPLPPQPGTLVPFVPAIVESTWPLLLVQPDNAIVLGGTIKTAVDRQTDFGFLRLLPTGAIDESFGDEGLAVAAFDLVGDDAEDRLMDVFLQGNRVLASGYARGPGPDNFDFALTRLTSDRIFFDGFGMVPSDD